jgi:hypothetical protein
VQDDAAGFHAVTWRAREPRDRPRRGLRRVRRRAALVAGREGEARELLVRPIHEFPAIYPPGGVDCILAQTGRHPYLERRGDKVAIAVPLFRDWIRTNCM